MPIKKKRRLKPMKKSRNNSPDKFVTALSTITGIKDGMFIKSGGDYIGAVKVPGIDIFNFKQQDREMSMSAFGNALSIVEIPTKYVFCGCKPDYSNQIANLAKHELMQKNPFLKHILERERSWLEYYQNEEEMRSVFVLFFSPDIEIIKDSIKKYMACLSKGKLDVIICKENDLAVIYKILLNGGLE
jgi:hypothetical protein